MKKSKQTCVIYPFNNVVKCDIIVIVAVMLLILLS